LNEAILSIYRELFQRRQNTPLTDETLCEEVHGEDERRLLLLIRFHEDLDKLFRLDLRRIKSREDLVMDIPSEDLVFAGSDDLSLVVTSPDFREAMYTLHLFLRELRRSTSDFIENLDGYLSEIENHTLERWCDKFSPEKTLFVMILRTWRDRLEELQAADLHQGLEVFPLTGTVPIFPGEVSEVRLAIGSPGKEILPGSDFMIVRTDATFLHPIDYTNQRRATAWPIRPKVEGITPSLARLRLWVKCGPETPVQGTTVTFAVEAPGWSGQCAVELIDSVKGQHNGITVSQWYEARKNTLAALTGTKVIVSVESNRLGVEDLSSSALGATLEKDGHRVEVRDFDFGAALPLFSDPDRIWVFNTTHFDHATALRRELIGKGISEIWDAHVAGYLADRFPALDIETEALELLEEYTRPVEDAETIERFFANLALKLERNPRWGLSVELVEQTREATIQLEQLVQSSISRLGQEEKVVLKALWKESRGRSSGSRSASCPLVELGAIAAALESSVSNLADVLERLCTGAALIERDGRLRSKYRFANRLYLEAAGGVFSKDSSNTEAA
jgi:hypothetical protein